MRRRNIIGGLLYAISVLWTAYLIFSTYGTNCFDLINTYLTLITLLLSMIFNDLIRGGRK